MKRIECLRFLSESITSELVVIGMSGQNWEWSQFSNREGNMKVGSMGNATAVGLGMALSIPHRQVVVLDSDGSVMLDLATLTTIGMYQPNNLAVFVFDNEKYSGSRISEPSATAYGANLEHMAKGAGIESARTVRDVGEFRIEAKDALGSDTGLSYIVGKVEEDLDARKLPKPTMDYLEYKYRFTRYIERTEGKVIHRSLR